MFNLYGTEGCHLCEIADEICLTTLGQSHFKTVDIVDDDQLLALYRIHIPVLENVQTGQKLFWPFSAEDINKIKS